MNVTIMRSRLLLVALPVILSYYLSTFTNCESTSTELLPIRYEAEEANNVHKASVFTANGVTFMDYHIQGSFIELPISIEIAGVYEVTIRYSAGMHSRPSELQVDNRVVHYKMEATEDWDTWKNEAHIVEIGPGMQTFRLIAVDSQGPNVDFLEIKLLYGIRGYTPPQQQEYDGNQWFISREKIETEFADGDSPEITIQYNVYKKIELQQVEVNIFSVDCSTPAEGVTQTTSFPNDLQASDPDLKILQLDVAVDETNLYETNIWETGDNQENTDGFIMLCARINLVSPDPSLVGSFVETILVQHVKLTAPFGIESIGVAEAVDEVVTSKADIQFLVTCCVCDMSFHCVHNPKPVEVNSDLHLCVHSNSNEVEIRRVTEFQLEQEDPEESSGTMIFRAVEKSTPNSLARVTMIQDDEHGDFASLVTRLVTVFFEGSSPNDIVANGRVLLAFKSSRKRQLLRSNSSSKGTRHVTFETRIHLKETDHIDSAAAVTMKRRRDSLFKSLLWTTCTSIVLFLAGGSQ